MSERYTCSPFRRNCLSDTDCTFAIDYGERDNECVVYLWATQLCEIFYVGSGGLSRPATIHLRSDSFKAKFDNGHAKCFIIASGLTKAQSLSAEAIAIRACLVKGLKLTNCVYPQTTDGWHDVELVVHNIISHCLDVLLSTDNGFTDTYSTLPKRGRNGKNAVAHLWEIDGIMDSAANWCRKYGVNLSHALSRMYNYNMTPREALSFPSVPLNKRKHTQVIAFWKNNGCIPGSDTTSRRVPYEEYPTQFRSRCS